MKMRRLCASIMAMLLAASMPLSALADDWYLENGDISVNANESGQTVSQGEKINVPDSAPVVTQKDSTVSTSNTVTINADSGSTANVTLSGVIIDVSGDSGKAAVEVTGSGNVVIELDGNNTVKGGTGNAGVEKQNSGNLTITDKNETVGSLEAIGGEGGAGIGGGYCGNGSNITISGGEVTAVGGDTLKIENENAIEFVAGAGIGGGGGGNGSGITISDGTVNAIGGDNAAGIGGGNNGNGSNITISGGTVNATGGDAPMNDDGSAGQGGGAGIGGGAYGSGDNIAIKNNAQVTAEGKGNAANIGNGNSEKDTEKQKDKVDLSGLSLYGKVNGVSGSKGSNLGEGVNSMTWTKNPSNSMGLKVGGDDVYTDVQQREDTLQITAMKDFVLVSGTRNDLQDLKRQGVSKINLETNRVNVSVSNEVLNKITGTGGGFQLSTDNTTVNLTATDQNNKKTLDMTLTANKQSGTQAALDQNSKKPEISIGSQSSTGNNSEGGTLQLKTTAPDATLTYSQKCAQTLMNSEFSKLALDVGNVIATVDSMLAANTAVNGTGSISIDNNSVIMNGIQFSAADSSENNKLDDVMNEIKFKMENKAQGGSTMVVEVDAKASVQSASLEVPGSALQSLMNQGVEETALSVNGKTTSIRNSDLREQVDDSQLDSKTLKINAIRDPNNGGDSVPNVTFWFPDSGADVDKAAPKGS